MFAHELRIAPAQHEKVFVAHHPRHFIVGGKRIPIIIGERAVVGLAAIGALILSLKKR
jgi:hypothetical protein